MKKLVFGLMTLFVIGVMSSCASNRGCGGSWYNNRNVQVEPIKTNFKSLDLEAELCNKDDTEYTD